MTGTTRKAVIGNRASIGFDRPRQRRAGCEVAELTLIIPSPRC